MQAACWQCSHSRRLALLTQQQTGRQSIRQHWPRELFQRHVARAVDYRTAAPPAKFDRSGTTEEVRAYLTKLGWERAWTDGITERMYKLEFETTLSRVEEVIKYLEGLGIPTHWVCNLAARVPAILGQDPQTQLQSVIDYIQNNGVKGEALLRLLRDYPRLLLFTPSSDGKVLQLGEARASVGIVQDSKGASVANVSYWREGAAFETAPVAPIKPSSSS